MSATTRVDFHVHSNHSDGLLNPEEVAAQLAASGVSYASLTDHDTIAGLASFERAARRRQMGTIPGVEMTVALDGEEVHLLAFGFEPDHPGLLDALAATRRARPPEAESGSMHRTLADRGTNGSSNGDAAQNGRLDIGDAIDLIHEAGGRAFLAHPLVVAPDTERLRALLEPLAERGLDGVEVFYGPYSEAQRARLLMVADELGLLVSGGSDLHEKPRGNRSLGVAVPTARWKRFRDAVLGDSGRSRSGAAVDQPRLRLKRRHFFLHVVLPTLLAIGLFFGVIFAILLPAFERSLLERKREMIRELTHSAISILMSYDRDVRNGQMTLDEAQSGAVRMISNLRYGPEGLDYFWIQDMHPRMVMHPYRTDLNGQDVSEFTDPRGVRIFVKFAEIVREQGGGYVDYVWQWKDDPTRLAPKESYVQGFQPWEWVIGTGLYTEDVQAEIARIEANLLRVSVVIIALIALLLSWVLRASLRLERRRREAEDGLRESTARYRSLVEATTEGALLVEDGRCRYANAILLQVIGASQEELELLDLEDVLPRTAQNEAAWAEIAQVLDGQAPSRGFEGVLLRRDGLLVECVLSLSRMTFAGQNALILLVKPIGGAAGGESVPDERALSLGSAADSVATGLLRARATPQGTVLHASRAAMRLLQMARPGGERPAALPELLGDDEAWSHLLDEATRTGAAERRLHLAGASGVVAVRLTATLARGADGRPAFLDCSLEDVTHEERRAAEREALIRRLQRAMLFLHEPVGNVRSVSITCRIDESVAAVVRRMTARGAGAALVEAAPGEVVGIFTDHDLRERVVAEGLAEKTPVGRVMSAPVASVSEHAEIYEALVVMEERGLQHLGVEDHTGRISGVIRHRELLQFPSYGPMVLAREIAHADSAEQVIAAALRAPVVAEALTDSGAPAERVTRMLTSVCDAATERFIELAQAELGPPPVPFCFLAEGSHGREELTPGSDQDNALVYADEGAGNEQVAEYFLALGRRVCGWLDDAGYPYCRGEIMAQNPRWSQPLSTWKRYFTEWVRTAEPQEVMEFLVFFDFRPVVGDAGLAEQLREHVFDEVRARPAFLAQLAQQVRRFKPPVRLFGRIITGGAADHDGRTGSPAFNVKDALASISGFARLYALRGRIAETNTWERLSALFEAGELTEASRDTSATAFSDLMRLRLESQARSRAAEEEPDNLIAWRALDDVERAMVNQAFAQIAALQSRVSHDFLADT